MSTNALQAALKNNEDLDKPLTLRPKIHDLVGRFLKDERLSMDLVDAFKSPLNVIFPQIIDENIAAFKAIYKKHQLKGQIYFTSKPNKSEAIMSQVSLHDVGVDVSSEGSLKVKLGCGFHPSRIECTGPKNLSYLTLALLQKVIINVNGFEEMDQILALRQTLNIKEKTQIFVRLSTFRSDKFKFIGQDGTLGIRVEEGPRILEYLKDNRESFDFLGFAYYWSGSNANDDQRKLALENSLALTLEAQKQGLNPRGLNIGGGFYIQYAESKDEWLRYIETIKQSMRYNDRSLTWNDTGLGLRNENGVIKGNPLFIDQYKTHTGAADFDQVLSLPLPSFNNMTAAQILSDCLLELYIEPGRSLLDQMGITIARVNFNRKSNKGETLVCLDMNRSNMNAADLKYLLDPIIIRADNKPRKACPEGVYYVGNLCLSYDMITYNKTFPDFLPEAGDLVVFVNTAAYSMDFIESETLYHKVAEKVAITEQSDRFRWFLDKNYNAIVEKFKGD